MTCSSNRQPASYGPFDAKTHVVLPNSFPTRRLLNDSMGGGGAAAMMVSAFGCEVRVSVTLRLVFCLCGWSLRAYLYCNLSYPPRVVQLLRSIAIYFTLGLFCRCKLSLRVFLDESYCLLVQFRLCDCRTPYLWSTSTLLVLSMANDESTARFSGV